jgi:hypothetical protein
MELSADDMAICAACIQEAMAATAQVLNSAKTVFPTINLEV